MRDRTLPSRSISRCEKLSIRGVSYNLRRWGPDGAPPILLVHGTQDSSITFQFLVDAFTREWSVFAPDWRGHGHSDRVPQSYWLHEFVADLDVIVDTLFPDRPIPLVGHSLGGNIASVFAGLRPERLTRLVSLDGFGPLMDRIPADMYSVLRNYLEIPKRTKSQSGYATLSDVGQRLRRANPRLTHDKAMFLAEHSSFLHPDGVYRWLFDPGHQASLPSLHRMEEWASIWSRIHIPVLWIASHDQRPNAPASHPTELAARSRLIQKLTFRRISDTGHNLHHDAPGRVAEAIERFLAGELVSDAKALFAASNLPV